MVFTLKVYVFKNWTARIKENALQMFRLNGPLNFVIQETTEYNRNSYLRLLVTYDSCTLTDTDLNLQHRNGVCTIQTNKVIHFGIV